jgi:hypothetical protein
MNHTIALSFEGGITRFIDAAPNQTVADAGWVVVTWTQYPPVT